MCLAFWDPWLYDASTIENLGINVDWQLALVSLGGSIIVGLAAVTTTYMLHKAQTKRDWIKLASEMAVADYQACPWRIATHAATGS